MTTPTDRERAAAWARDILALPDLAILDTETTGLGGSAEIVQIAIIDRAGAILLDTLIKPTKPIPKDATRIHGITDARVATAPTFAEIYNSLIMAVGGKACVIYNAEYDIRMIAQSEAAHPDLPPIRLDGWRSMAVWHCAMRWYSQWVGDWNPRYRNYRYQKLPGGDHTALGDCRACLAVLKRMAGTYSAAMKTTDMQEEQS